MIEIKGISKSFGKHQVLDEINLTIEDGTIFGLIGINGAGKSTLLRILSGVFKADSGEVLYDGKPVYDNPEAKKDIFFLPDDPYYTSYTTGKMLKELYKSFYEFDDSLFDKYITLFNLDLNKKINNFSKGMRRQLFLAIAIATGSKYIFLDEAFDGLDPQARLEFKEAITNLQQARKFTVIISTHSLRELQGFCDTFGVIDGRKIKFADEGDDSFKMKKYQIMLKDNAQYGVFMKEVGVESSEMVGSILNFTSSLPENYISDIANKYNPVLFERIQINFEEVFIHNTKGGK